MIEKILGYLLLVLGICVIGWGLYTSYQIFSGAALPPEIFHVAEKSAIAPRSKENANLTAQDEMRAQASLMIGQQLQGMIPPDTIPRTLNMTMWSLFAGLLFVGGGQISTLGIKLLKK